MKRFLSSIALFFLPILAVIGLFCGVIYTSGEWYTEEAVAEKVLAGEPAFFGLAYRDNTRYYKHLVAGGKAADLLVLGTSRSMQFHSEFFTNKSFYNAGGASSYVNEFQFFLEQLPEIALPSTLLLVMDQYFFNENWVGTGSMPDGFDYNHYDFSPFGAVMESMRSWSRGRYRIRDVLFHPPNQYGMAATGRGSGFYTDGSYSYGRLLDHPEEGTDVGFHDSFDRIARGVNRFEYGDTLYPKSLQVVEQLLEWCHSQGIQVVMVIPPYAPSVYQRMMEQGGYGYLSQIAPALTQLAAPYGYEVFDFTFMPDTSDAGYLDGYHGGDRVYAQLTLQLAETSQLLAGQIDTDYLTKALADSGNPLRLASVQ